MGPGRLAPFVVSVALAVGCWAAGGQRAARAEPGGAPGPARAAFQTAGGGAMSPAPRQSDLREWLTYLASDALEGRATYEQIGRVHV